MTDEELQKIAETYGTPVYVFDIKAFRTRINEIKKIGAKIGAKYLNMILKVETFESLNILIYGLLPIAKLSLLINLDIPIQPVIEITIIKIKDEA